jgi:hypothetical protein
LLTTRDYPTGRSPWQPSARKAKLACAIAAERVPALFDPRRLDTATGTSRNCRNNPLKPRIPSVIPTSNSYAKRRPQSLDPNSRNAAHTALLELARNAVNGAAAPSTTPRHSRSTRLPQFRSAVAPSAVRIHQRAVGPRYLWSASSTGDRRFRHLEWRCPLAARRRMQEPCPSTIPHQRHQTGRFPTRWGEREPVDSSWRFCTRQRHRPNRTKRDIPAFDYRVETDPARLQRHRIASMTFRRCHFCYDHDIFAASRRRTSHHHKV